MKQYSRTKPRYHSFKKCAELNEFWVSPLNLTKPPSVIHKIPSNNDQQQNYYLYSSNDLNKMRRACTPNRPRVRTQTSTPSHSAQMSKTFTHKQSVRTESAQDNSFLNMLERKTGIQLNNIITKKKKKNISDLYAGMTINLSIAQQREIVRKCALYDQNQMEEKCTYTNDWSRTQSYKFRINNPFSKTYKRYNELIYFRMLQSGEEAAALECMIELLESQDDMVGFLIRIKIESILKEILEMQQLEYLQNYSVCMKQLEYHWQLFITKLLSNQQQNVQTLDELIRKGHCLDLREGFQTRLGILLQQYILQT